MSVIEEIFNGASNLLSVNLSKTKFSSVTTLYGLLGGASAVKTLNLSGADFSSVTDISSDFAVGNTALESINLSGVNFSSLTKAQAMFNSCSVLETVDFRGIDTSKLTNSSSVFNNVNGAKIYVSSNTDKTNIENMLTASSASANVLVK